MSGSTAGGERQSPFRLGEEEGKRKKLNVKARLSPSLHNRGQYFATLFLTSQDGEEAHDRLDALVEIRNMELFVGGMNVVVGKTEAH